MTNWEAFGIMKLISYDMEYGGHPHIDAEVEELKLIALDKAMDALEKQIPKKPRCIGDGYADGEMVYDEWECPCCGEVFEVDGARHYYCPNCGQGDRLEW